MVGSFAAMAAGILFVAPIYQYGTRETVTILVKEKERITTGSGKNLSSKYLVYSDLVNSTGEKIGEEVFQNTDALWSVKFNSSDIQGRLEKGRVFKVKVYGWRISLFSSYRNIVGIE